MQELVHGYRLVRKKAIEEWDVVFYEFEHVKTKARHIHLANKDQENCFSVAFRTIPTDSTGVAHILEHLVLCGSKKYPVRDPFFGMIKRSVNTFMNAMTSTDFTAYPFASRNKVDFFNLMDVYLDAVFNPLLRELDFMQEGHRFEIVDGENGEELKLAGVVYNEMKGSMARTNNYILKRLKENIFQKSTYRYNSGGEPATIPDLSYEALVEFHEQFYHPSNAYFYTYGTIPYEEHLAFINDHYLSHYECAEINIQPGKETPKTTAEFFEFGFPMNEEEDDGENSVALVSWYIGEVEDEVTRLALNIIDAAIMGSRAAPLTKKINESKLCKGVSELSGYGDSYLESVFTIGLDGIKKSDYKKAEKLIFSSLKTIVEEGIDKKEVEQVLHGLEFSTHDIEPASTAFGLEVAFRIFSDWLQQRDVYLNLKYDETLVEFKKRYKKQGYLESLIEKYLLSNSHQIQLLAYPDYSLEERMNVELAMGLREKLSQMSEEEKQEIRKNSILLEEHQKAFQDVNVLPKLQINDMLKEQIKFNDAPHIEEIYGVPCFHYLVPTNGIIKTTFYFKLPKLTVPELQYAALFSFMLPKLGTIQESWDEKTAEVNLNCGWFRTSLDIKKMFNDEEFSAFFRISASALYRNTQKMFDIMGDYMLSYLFKDVDHAMSIIREYLKSQEQNFSAAGNKIAAEMAASELLKSSYLEEHISGLSWYRFLKSISTKGKPHLAEALGKAMALGRKLMVRENLVVRTLGGDEKLEKGLRSVLKKLPEYDFFDPVDFPMGQGHRLDQPKSKAYLITTPVSYVAKVIKTIDLLHEDAATLAVLGAYLSLSYVHTEVREKGGAYGGSCRYNLVSGLLTFSSFRDPSLRNTINVFEEATKFIRKNPINMKELDDIKITILGNLDNVGSLQALASSHFNDLIGDLDFEMRQKFRENIFAVTPEDIVRCAEKYLSSQSAYAMVTSPSIFDKEKLDGFEQINLI